MLTILDAIIILTLLAGAVLGFKKGVIKSAVTLIGTIAAVIIAYMLKNPISSYMYNIFPFFNFSGALEGVTVLNIVIYEVLAFLIAFSVVGIILRIIIKISGIIESILKATIILGIPSKLLGLVFGFFEACILVFVVLFVFAQFSFSASLIRESKWATTIVSKIPFVSNIASNSFNSVTEIIDLQEKYKNNSDKNAYNLEALDILLKHEVVTINSATKLIETGKLKINGAEVVLQKYKN